MGMLRHRGAKVWGVVLLGYGSAEVWGNQVVLWGAGVEDCCGTECEVLRLGC